ncbi:MAG: 23S rRNA (uracil-5-)-methyltransferase RumA, partial [Nanoarchaeota archaeon]|nr:23S rRNA (uracil-5-)-methyltransferase RumA [Nanoarchaeota archaeon]
MRTALCPYFGKCGGCSAQHIEYEVQLDNKRKMLGQAIQYDSDDIKVFSGKEFGYRNRMDFVFHPGGIGFREKGKWQNIVD